MTTTTISREEKGWRVVYLIYGLMALGFLTSGMSAVVGVILAHMKRGRGATYAINTHLKRQIDIFWTVIAVGIIGIILVMFWIGGLILFALSLWYLYALAKGTIAAMNHEDV